MIETGPVVETFPVGGGGVETTAKPITVNEPAAAPAAAPVEKAPSIDRPVGKARERMFSEMEKKARISPPASEEPAKPAPASEAKPADQPEEEAPPEETPVAPEKGKRESPWKLVDQYKEKAKSLEKEIADLRSKIAPEKDFQVLQEKVTKLESDLAERENFIRMHRYERSQEFQDKYQKPYEQAWQRAAKKMAEISVVDQGTGQERPATVNDMELIVNAPLGRARKMATELFGDFANDAMVLREKIIEMHEAQAEAIKTAQAEGAAREKTEAENATRMQAERVKKLNEAWAQANKEVIEHEKFGQYFKPREGDEEWNKRLAKGTELVDKAFASIRPFIADPAALPEVVKLHAVLRHRAIAFGPLRHENEILKADRDAWKAKYESIAKSTPPAGQGAPRQDKPAVPAKARDRLFAEMDKIAVG